MTTTIPVLKVNPNYMSLLQCNTELHCSLLKKAVNSCASAGRLSMDSSEGDMEVGGMLPMGQVVGM